MMAKRSFPIDQVMCRIERACRAFRETSMAQVSRRRDPFRVLIGCIISLRTKDEVTHTAAARLFAEADTPSVVLKLREKQIARLIFPAGFYNTKAKTIREVCRRLIDDFDGKVPDDLDQLLTLKGVGRKTANLVITMGFNKPGICVDTHVHRISNRWGLIKTKSPDKSEMALRKTLPKRHWIQYNDLLVTYGQNICTPISPHCSRCDVEEFCRKINVGKSR